MTAARTAICGDCAAPLDHDPSAAYWGYYPWHDSTLDVDNAGRTCPVTGDHHDPKETA